MMTIKRTNDAISMSGHAEGKIPCAMMTALSVSVLENVTKRLHCPAVYELDVGNFYLRTEGLNEEAMRLVDAFWYSVQSIAQSYPDSFRITV